MDYVGLHTVMYKSTFYIHVYNFCVKLNNCDEHYSFMFEKNVLYVNFLEENHRVKREKKNSVG